jgi:hypothetical protein
VSEQPSKRELEQAALQAYLAKGTQPAPVPGDKPTPPPAAEINPQIEGIAKTGLEASAAPADDSAPVETVAKPPAARKTAPPKKADPMPWDEIPDVDTAKFSMLYSTVLDAKMVWIGQNMPGGKSKQKMVKEALSEWVEKKLRELTK